MATTTSQIQEIYVGLLGRAADAEGLAYWTAEIDGGVLTIEQLRANIVNEQAEYATGLGSLTRAQLVNSLYNNLFNRDADDTGLEYWVNGAGSSVNADQLVLALSDGASAADRLILDNRTTAATYYTENSSTYNATEAAEVISDVGSSVASLNAAKTSVDNGSIGSGNGSAFVLTSEVDSISGSALNDTITGLIGVSGTYGAGDNIVGGSGTDTLSIIDAGSATSVGLVSVDGVEVINVRMVSAGTTILNGNDFSGVQTLANASSIAGSTLQATGIELATDITVHGDTDVNIGYVNTTTATDAASVSLVSVGNANTATTLGSASAAATANIDLDVANAGLITSVTVDVEGSANIARLEAGSNVATYTLTGSGNAILVTDDKVTSIAGTAAEGNLDITLSGASDVAMVLGGGDDTVRFGTTYSNNDSVDGGDGDDTVTLSLGGFNRNLDTTNVENLTVTYNDADGGNLNASGVSDVSSYAFVAGSANADVLASQLQDGATITVASNNIDDMTLDFADAASATFNVGSATGAVGIDEFNITDVAAVTINGVGSGATFDSASFDADTTSLAVVASGAEANMTITMLTADALETLSITSNGSASVTLTSGLEANTGLQSVTVLAQGSDAGDVTIGGLNNSGSALGFNSLTLTANSGADIVLGAVEMGNGATAATTGTIVVNSNGNGSDAGTTAMDVTVTGNIDLTLDLNAAASADIVIGDVTFDDGTAVTAASDASLIVEDLTVGAAGYVEIEKVAFTAAQTGLQINVGEIVVGTSAGFTLGGSGGIAGTNVANVDVSDISVDVQADGSATFGTILTTGGVVGDITTTVADSGSATYGAVVASGVGAITITAAGDGEVDHGQITLASNLGAITLNLSDESDATFGAITAGGDIDSIVVNIAASATANFGDINASGIGDITVSGAGFVDFGQMSAVNVGTISSTLTSGTFRADLSAVTNAVEVSLSSATNTIESGAGNDVITLAAGATGNDTILFNTATDGTDQIANFAPGDTGNDLIGFGTGFVGASVGIMVGSGVAVTSTTLVAEVATTASGAITIDDTVSIVLVGATSFASTAAFVSAIATGGSLEIGAGTAGTGASLVVVWTDGNDSYVSLVGTTAAASGTNALIEDGSALATVAILEGITPAALAADNFDVIDG